MERAPPPGAPRSSRAVLAARLLLLSLAAGSAAASFLLFRPGLAPQSRGERYLCPMHPEVSATGPGSCPICRMELVPAAAHSGGSAGVPPPTGSASTGDAGAPLLSLSEEAARNLPGDAIEVVRRRVLSREVIAPSWVEEGGLVAALVPKDQLGALAGAGGSLHPALSPRTAIRVQLVAGPPVAWDSSTAQVHFRPDGSVHALRPGEVGWVRLPAARREVLVVPLDAIRESPRGPFVLVASKDGRTFARRSVELGSTLYGMAAVVSGLSEHERIAVREVSLLDAERLRAGTGGATGVRP